MNRGSRLSLAWKMRSPENKPKTRPKATAKHNPTAHTQHKEDALSFCSTRRTTSNFEPVQRKYAIVFVLAAKQASSFRDKIPFHRRITIYRPLSSDHFLRSFLSSTTSSLLSSSWFILLPPKENLLTLITLWYMSRVLIFYVIPFGPNWWWYTLASLIERGLAWQTIEWLWEI